MNEQFLRPSLTPELKHKTMLDIKHKTTAIRQRDSSVATLLIINSADRNLLIESALESNGSASDQLINDEKFITEEASIQLGRKTWTNRLRGVNRMN